jgi:hypothetical protein
MNQASVRPAGAGVSVVIPVYNRQSFVVQAVRSACSQEPHPAEVLVVDDGSTDGSAGAVAGLCPVVRIIRQQHSGRSAARNTGVQAAESEFVAFLDSDDEWAPGKLATQLAIFQRFPAAGMVAGHVWVTDAWGTVVPDSTNTCRRILDAVAMEKCSPEALIRHSGIYTSTVMIRRRVLDDVGLFDEGLPGNEDWDVWLRISRRWQVAVAPWPPVARYRVHGHNTTSVDMAQGTARLAQRHLAMRPRLSSRARALLLVHEARAHRTLGEEQQARSALVGALGTAPLTAIGAGAARLTVGSLLPVTLARTIREFGHKSPTRP